MFTPARCLGSALTRGFGLYCYPLCALICSEKVRKTRETLSTREEEEQRMVLGAPGQPFSFERDSPCEVSFEATSATNGTIDAVKAFIDA